MKTKELILSLLLMWCIVSCNSKKKENKKVNSEKETYQKQDSVSFSFVFLGCNRVDRHQQGDTTATNASTANLSAMKRIWTEVANLPRKPELFFFLGDMVLAETDTINLNSQLKAWIKLYKNTDFSPISTANIETVAVPGNHEMLYWHDYNVPNHDEWPLKGATQVWMKHMADFMPKDRDHITGNDSINNQMTFAFTRKNIGFIVMNTDTYNVPTKENPYGLEGQIPTNWIITKVEAYKNDPAIEHIFVLGHKPYYVDGKPHTGHHGIPEGPVLWPKLEENKVTAMLSAHVHDYQRMQPGNKGTYQVIAGNAGSPGSAKFFGYTKIDIMRNGEARLTAVGYNVGDPYYKAVPENPSSVRDETILSWTKNKNPYQKN